MSEPATAFSEGRDQETMFKSRELLAYACGFVRAGLALLDRGIGYVGSDDVEESVVPGPDSPGIAGSAVTMLRNAGVIRDHWGTHADADPPVHGGRRRSKRESANSRKVGTYEICSRSIAETFLRKNGKAVAPAQREMTF